MSTHFKEWSSETCIIWGHCASNATTILTKMFTDRLQNLVDVVDIFFSARGRARGSLGRRGGGAGGVRFFIENPRKGRGAPKEGGGGGGREGVCGEFGGEGV